MKVQMGSQLISHTAKVMLFCGGALPSHYSLALKRILEISDRIQKQGVFLIF
jgi:hypothetical protein